MTHARKEADFLRARLSDKAAHAIAYGFLAITGKDAQKFLQGYATCDIEDITDTLTAIGATLNLQGRMVTSFRLARIEDGFLLRMSRDLVPATQEFLKKYIVFSKAQMNDLSDTLYCYGISGEVDGGGVLCSGQRAD